MLLAPVPPALVLPVAGPVIDPEALLQSMGILALVNHALSIHIDAVPVHPIVFPVAVVPAAIRPAVGANAIHNIQVPITFIE